MAKMEKTILMFQVEVVFLFALLVLVLLPDLQMFPNWWNTKILLHEIFWKVSFFQLSFGEKLRKFFFHFFLLLFPYSHVKKLPKHKWRSIKSNAKNKLISRELLQTQFFEKRQPQSFSELFLVDNGFPWNLKPQLQKFEIQIFTTSTFFEFFQNIWRLTQKCENFRGRFLKNRFFPKF